MTVIVLALLIYALWPLYVFVMAIQRAHELNSVSKTAWALALPLIVIALTLDVILNYTVFALLTLDFPRAKEYTFSQRLNRLASYSDWRGSVARWVASSLLDPYDHDPKGHIKK